MSSFYKDKKTGKWYCDNCGKEIPKKELLKPYNYFSNEDDSHNCRKNDI